MIQKKEMTFAMKTKIILIKIMDFLPKTLKKLIK